MTKPEFLPTISNANANGNGNGNGNGHGHGHGYGYGYPTTLNAMGSLLQVLSYG